MTTGNETRRYGRRAVAFGAAGLAIYLVMINVTLAEIEAISGHTPFDMRPFGYGPQDAANILHGLGDEGRRYYLTRQLPLDTAYPGLLAATLISVFEWLRPRQPYGKLAQFGVWCSIGAAFFDYVENLGIVGMILRWPDLPDLLVNASSSATVTKSGLTVVAVATVSLLVAAWAWRLMISLCYPRFSSSARKS